MKRIIRIVLTYLYGLFLRKNKVIIAPSVILTKKTFFEGYNMIHKKCNLVNSQIGRGSYVGENSSLPLTKIGRYCSIAQNVKVLPYTHPSSVYVSTYPAFFSVSKQGGFTFTEHQKFDETLYLNDMKTICVEIGNDVWIGEDVKILGGIKIGDGAIVATGAVVTKDIEPYCIVGGVPAKCLKKRFNNEEIEFLLHFKWWDRSHKWFKENVDLFCNIKFLMSKYKE